MKSRESKDLKNTKTFYESFKRVAFAFCAVLLTAFGTAHATNLPAGYTELEYIQTDGDSWIDTNVVPTATTLQVDYKMQLLQQAYISFFGSVAATTPRKGLRIYYQPTNSTAAWTIQSGASTTKQNITWNSVLQGTVVATQNNLVVSTVNGDTLSQSGAVDLTNPDSILIGTTHLGSGTSGRAPVKIWSFTITKNNNVVFNGIPAKNSSNVIGMYDLVSGTFFTNAGTGTFTAGPIVCPNGETLQTGHQSGLPLGYTLLESITGYSNQSVINSGVGGNNDNLRIVIRASKDTSQNYTPLFGNYVDESSNVTRVIAGSPAGYVIFDLNRRAAASDLVTGVRFTDLHTYDLYKDENGRSVLEIDGEVAGTSANTQGTENATNISIGNSRVLTQEPSTLASTYWYFYFCKIYDDGVLIRDYVPVKRDSDNVVGVYDLVNNTFDPGQYPNFAPFTAGSTVSDPIVEQCVAGTGIKIATTKYNEEAFAGLVTTLNEAITKVTNIVNDTVSQANSIGELAQTKQDRPADGDCPEGRKCLLVTGVDGQPHWYLIEE